MILRRNRKRQLKMISIQNSNLNNQQTEPYDQLYFKINRIKVLQINRFRSTYFHSQIENGKKVGCRITIYFTKLIHSNGHLVCIDQPHVSDSFKLIEFAYKKYILQLVINFSRKRKGNIQPVVVHSFNKRRLAVVPHLSISTITNMDNCNQIKVLQNV